MPQQQHKRAAGFIPAGTSPAARSLTALLVGLLFVRSAIAAETGTITGVVEDGSKVTAVYAIDRAGEQDKKFPGKLDPKTGRFTIEGLKPGVAYDCVIDQGTVRLEGVNLRVPRSDYEKEQPLTKADVEEIKKVALSLNKFEDIVEVMTVAGNIQHAAVILNKVRTKPFVNSRDGEVIWRLEVWHFERPDETWIKVQDELAIVFYRERLQKTDFDKKALTLDPQLGGLKPTDEKPTVDVGTVKLPGKETGIKLRPFKDPLPVVDKRDQ